LYKARPASLCLQLHEFYPERGFFTNAAKQVYVDVRWMLSNIDAISGGIFSM
jgi:hypothetical protein